VRRHGWFQRLADEFHLSLIEDAAQTIWSALGKRAE
jgi:dTDP-4-amino-4,6-dideoxygalactose transaminase